MSQAIQGHVGIAQLDGNAIDLGAGAAGAGTVRVIVASDSPGAAPGAVVGNGAAATAQRVTIANDSTGILAGVTTVSTLTGGGVAHDGVDSGNPIKTGARAVSTLSTATLVSAADRAGL